MKLSELLRHLRRSYENPINDIWYTKSEDAARNFLSIIT